MCVAGLMCCLMFDKKEKFQHTFYFSLFIFEVIKYKNILVIPPPDN